MDLPIEVPSRVCQDLANGLLLILATLPFDHPAKKQLLERYTTFFKLGESEGNASIYRSSLELVQKTFDRHEYQCKPLLQVLQGTEIVYTSLEVSPGLSVDIARGLSRALKDIQGSRKVLEGIEAMRDKFQQQGGDSACTFCPIAMLRAASAILIMCDCPCKLLDFKLRECMEAC